MKARKQLMTHIVVYAVGFTVLAVLLRWWFLPVGAAVSILHYALSSRLKRARYRSIFEGARAAYIDSIPTPDEMKSRDIDDLLLDTLKDVTSELEDKYYQLVEKNIQVLSLKEISLTIISSLNEPRIVDSVHSFLAKGLGFKEVFVGIINQDKREIRLYTFREIFGETRREDRTAPLDDVHGILRKSIILRKPVLIKDADMHPVGEVAGQPVFPDSTMKSYIVVPMVKSTMSQHCWKSPDCLLKSDAARETQGPLSMTPSPDESPLEEGICRACGRLPVMGVVGVTDGYKAGALVQVDLVAVETLALQISTLLENTQLYGELKYEENFRDNVINSMMNGLITADVDGTIRLVNEPAERLTGFTAEELKGMSIDRVIIETQAAGREGPVTRSLKRGEKVFQREVLLAKKDGTKLPIVLNTSPLLDEEKRIQGTIALFLDIARIKRMEEKILQLDKLAALGRFSSSMAHEIRNPLAGIVAGLQYIDRVGGIGEEHKDNISFILGEVRRIDRLISDILNVVKAKELVRQETSLEAILKNGITSVQDAAKRRRVTISVDAPAESRPVWLDADRITQVVINLLRNAVEASREGGDIRVRIRYPEDVQDVLFDEHREFAIIEIEDEGVGFSEEEKNRIFEPFFTTKKEGAGLGLYVSHSIIERHGGFLFLESEKDKGSVFSVYLPVEKVQYGDSSEISHPSGR